MQTPTPARFGRRLGRRAWSSARRPPCPPPLLRAPPSMPPAPPHRLPSPKVCGINDNKTTVDANFGGVLLTTLKTNDGTISKFTNEFPFRNYFNAFSFTCMPPAASYASTTGGQQDQEVISCEWKHEHLLPILENGDSNPSLAYMPASPRQDYCSPCTWRADNTICASDNSLSHDPCR